MNLDRRDFISLASLAGILPMGSGAAIFAAVVGGSADIGSGSLFPVFAAFGRGLPLRIIAPVSLYTSERADALMEQRFEASAILAPGVPVSR